MLTLGIGVNAGIFGIINGLMIRPLAGADAPGEVVGVYSKDRTTERGYRAFSYPGSSTSVMQRDNSCKGEAVRPLVAEYTTVVKGLQALITTIASETQN